MRNCVMLSIISKDGRSNVATHSIERSERDAISLVEKLNIDYGKTNFTQGYAFAVSEYSRDIIVRNK